MDVAFRHLEHNKTFVDSITALFTNSKYVHAEIIFSNGQVGGAWLKTGCVAFRDAEEVIKHPTLYTYIPVDEEEVSEQATYDYVQSKLGQKFSIKSSLSNILFPINDDKWHCGDFAFCALIAGGLKTKDSYLPSEIISPKRLYNILTKEKGWQPMKDYNYDYCCA